jgi:Ca-activated chloride channel family protein
MKRTFLALGLLLLTTLLAGAYPLLEIGSEWLTVRWERPLWLFGLLLVPLVLYWSTVGQDKRSPRVRIGSLDPLRRGPVGWRARLVDLPGILRTVAIAFCLLALAKPVSVRGPTEAEEEGIDLVVALDLSGSMRAVMDNLPADLEKYLTPAENSPVATRLDAAKAVLRDFIARRKSDRIGVVVFGRSAYVVSPPTLDYQLLDALVSRMQLELIDPNGTAIGDALGVAVARLRKSEAKSRVIVLLTDGDAKGGELAPEYAAHLANVIGAQVYPIQVGEGDIAKVYRGSDLFGQARFEAVAFPTNPELLRKIAEQTGGKAYVANDAASLQASLHDVLDRLEKTAFEAAKATYQDLFRFLLLPGVLLIFLEALLTTLVQRRFP